MDEAVVLPGRQLAWLRVQADPTFAIVTSCKIHTNETKLNSCIFILCLNTMASLSQKHLIKAADI